MTIQFLVTFLVLLTQGVQGRPQLCEIFDNCGDDTPVSTAPTTPKTFLECTIFENCDDEQDREIRDTECFSYINEIDAAISLGDTRSAFNDCDIERPCSYYRREGYSCANPWNCNENRTIITDGKGLIDVRQAPLFTLDISDSKCEKTNQICCKRPNFRVPEPPTLAEQPMKDFIDEAAGFEKCGRSAPGKYNITGGDQFTAQPTEFPHMCVIYRTDNGQRVYVGGASLIAKNKVLTIAHKFKVTQGGGAVDWTNRPNVFSVRCGEYNVKEETELLEAQEAEVAEIFLHPEYDERRVTNNLAILRTEKNFLYQEHIGPVCLPRPNEAFDNEKGRECWSSGWGADQFAPQAAFSDELKKVKLDVVNRQECQRKLQKTERFKNVQFKLHESWMCIGGEEGKDTCKGDGGSPHVCKSRNGDLVQVGSVAWGVECGKPVPSVYSSIPNAMCWIDWVMSCVGDAETNIGGIFAGALDLRQDGDFPSSINSIADGDCQDWMNSHFDLQDRCDVQYNNVDERSAGK